ncbi:hypothetical protein ACFLWC_04590 [Chloroflexota bacterium]
MVQKILYIFLGIVIGILTPFARDIYHGITTPPYDFASVWRGIMNSLAGLAIVVVAACLILLVAHFHDKRENQSRIDAMDKHMEQAVQKGIKAAIAELTETGINQPSSSTGVNHKISDDDGVNQ